MVAVSGGEGKVRRRYRRRAIVLDNVVSVEAYLQMVEESRVQPPGGCPDGCDGGWRRHSCFQRRWVDYDCVVFVVVIVRFRCGGRCGAVWSLFPALVWYRFRFCHRLVQATVYRVIAGSTPTAAAKALEESLCPLVESTRVPSASTIRSWVQWLGQRCLEPLVDWTLSHIARMSAEAARAVAHASPPMGPGRDEPLRRASRLLQRCAALDAVTKGRADFFRRAPNQLRDWARRLFWERRQTLARPP
jgi:hypothetical protein